MQYWEDDEATRVCLLSLDSIGNPRKFSRIARRLTRRKPVVVIAPGRADRAANRGGRGGLSHAPDSAVDALFRQAGVMVVHRRGAMIDVAKFCARLPLPAGPRVKVITNSFTLAAQLCHAIEAVGLLTAGSAPGAAAELPGRGLRGRRPAGVGRDGRRFGGGGHGRGVRVRHRSHPCGAGEGGQRSGQAAAHGAAGLRVRADPPRGAGSPRGDGHLRVAERRDLRFVRRHRVRPLARTRSGRGAAAGHRRGRRPPGGQPGAFPRTPRRSADQGGDVGAAGGVRDRAGAELSRAQSGRGRRDGRAARLERRAQGVGPGAPRATRPGQRAPQPRRRRGDGARLARPDRPGLRTGLRAMPRICRWRCRWCRRWRRRGSRWWWRAARTPHSVRSSRWGWTGSPANCWATSSTGCRR